MCVHFCVFSAGLKEMESVDKGKKKFVEGGYMLKGKSQLKGYSEVDRYDIVKDKSVGSSVAGVGRCDKVKDKTVGSSDAGVAETGDCKEYITISLNSER